MGKKQELSKGCSEIGADEEKRDDDEFLKMLSSLPIERHWNATFFYLYQNFWCPSVAIKAFVSFQNHFKARDSDLILASIPKSGTTWLKALAFATANRSKYTTLIDSPLLTKGPHDVVRFLELDIYLNNPSPDLDEDHPTDGPRIFATHCPYASLPSSITDSKCRIVYVCRNPLDQLISNWKFFSKYPREANMEPLSLDAAFEKFSRGVHSFGPCWDHVLGFWKASLERPDKVLFFKYEDMKEDTLSHLRRLAEFLGFPFSLEEENQGVMDEIIKLCSFETMKDLEANNNGRHVAGAPNSAFFRKGEVGDWTNYLTPSMVQCLQKLMEEKLAGSGLTFKVSGQVQDHQDSSIQPTTSVLLN